MSNYRVEIPYLIWVTMEVDAPTEESAVNKAEEITAINCQDRMIGIEDGNIEFSGEVFELDEICINVTKG